MSSVEWDFQIGEREIGPFTTQQVAEMARNGQLRPDDPVRKGTDGAWILASHVKGLAFTAAASPDPTTSTLPDLWESGHRPDAIPLATPFTATSEPGPDGQAVIEQPSESPFPSAGIRHKTRPSVTATTRVRSARHRRNIAFLISAGTACGAIIVAFTVFIALNASNDQGRSPKARSDSTQVPAATHVKPEQPPNYLYLDNDHPDAANEDTAEVASTVPQSKVEGPGITGFGGGGYETGMFDYMNGSGREVNKPPTKAKDAVTDRPVVQAPSKPSPRAVEPIPPTPVLYMTFDEGTVSPRGGKLHVKDLSPAGNHGVGEGVGLASNGLSGNALSLKGGGVRIPRMLLNGRKEYTIAFWIMREVDDSIAFEEFADGGAVLYSFAGSTFLNAWNKNSTADAWKGGTASTDSLPVGQWSFLACVFKSDTGYRGRARISVDEKSFELQTHAVDNENTGYDEIHGKSGMVDELVVYGRALSDAEVRVVYERGKSKQHAGSK